MRGKEILESMKTWLDSDAMGALVGAYRAYPGMVRTSVIRTGDLLTPDQFAVAMGRLKTAVDAALATGAEMRPVAGDRTFALLQMTLENMFSSTQAPEEVSGRDIYTAQWLGGQMRAYFNTIGAVRGGQGWGGLGGVG